MLTAKRSGIGTTKSRSSSISTETGEGGFIYSGNYWYGLVDANGEEVWLRNMEGLAGYAVALRPAGGLHDRGPRISGAEWGFALGIDEDGNVQWRTTFPDAAIYRCSRHSRWRLYPCRHSLLLADLQRRMAGRP